jgi:hypothetical protein
MARIRTVKPEFFRHEQLFEAEKETGLPLRLAFIGLWTAADRDGRFRWQPRALKLDCLPYDDADFSRVLDALATRGLVVAYEVDGVKYGHIPTWQKHQVINNREMASNIPAPNVNNVLTRDARVDDATATPLVHTQGEGKGREEEEEGKELTSAKSRPKANADFEELKRKFPKRLGDYKWALAERKFNSLVKTGVPSSAILAAVSVLYETHRKLGNIGTQFVPMPATWLNSEDFLEVAVSSFDPPADLDWDVVLTNYKKFNHWSRDAGPDLESPACRAPKEMLEKYGLELRRLDA